MRIAALLMLVGAAGVAARSMNGDAFGSWKVNPGRSTNPYTGSLVLRIEPHAKGEVFTFDKTDADGRATSVSTILYLDGKAHDFQDAACSGTQSSWRADSRTVEILRQCGGGKWIRFVRRDRQPKGLILDVTEQDSDGYRVERRLLLEKQ